MPTGEVEVAGLVNVTVIPAGRAGLTVPVILGTAAPYWYVTEAAVTASTFDDVAGTVIKMGA
jgi:hypothetical protein